MACAPTVVSQLIPSTTARHNFNSISVLLHFDQNRILTSIRRKQSLIHLSCFPHFLCFQPHDQTSTTNQRPQKPSQVSRCNEIFTCISGNNDRSLLLEAFTTTATVTEVTSHAHQRLLQTCFMLAKPMLAAKSRIQSTLGISSCMKVSQLFGGIRRLEYHWSSFLLY